MKKIFFLASLTGAMCMALANCPNVPIPDRYVLNGDEATDKRTGLIWKRCTEKLAVYNKNTLDCDPAVDYLNQSAIDQATFTHEEALAWATDFNRKNPSPTPWRLPNIRELTSLFEWGCDRDTTGFKQSRMIDPGAFPHAAEVYWSSTPDTTGAYGADFFLAQAIPYYRYSKAAVRLVRDAR